MVVAVVEAWELEQVWLWGPVVVLLELVLLLLLVLVLLVEQVVAVDVAEQQAVGSAVWCV